MVPAGLSGVIRSDVRGDHARGRCLGRHRGRDGDQREVKPCAVTLPQQRITDFRRYYGHQDELIEAVRGGSLSRRSLLLKVDQWEAVDEVAGVHQHKAWVVVGVGCLHQLLGRVERPSR